MDAAIFRPAPFVSSDDSKRDQNKSDRSELSQFQLSDESICKPLKQNAKEKKRK